MEGGEQTPADPAPLSLAARREIPEVPVGEDLSPSKRHDLDEIILQYRDVFSDLPGRTAVTHHDIRMAPGVRVRVPPLPLRVSHLGPYGPRCAECCSSE